MNEFLMRPYLLADASPLRREIRLFRVSLRAPAAAMFVICVLFFGNPANAEPIEYGNVSSVIISGKTATTTTMRNAMSSRSSSRQQADGSRDDLREVRISNGIWTVTVASTDHYPANSSEPSIVLAVVVEDRSGQHALRSGESYTAPDGAFIRARDNGASIAQVRPHNTRELTEILRETAAGGGARLNVTQHLCQGNHC